MTTTTTRPQPRHRALTAPSAPRDPGSGVNDMKPVLASAYGDPEVLTLEDVDSPTPGVSMQAGSSVEPLIIVEGA